jgi:hypothetical protein
MHKFKVGNRVSVAGEVRSEVAVVTCCVTNTERIAEAKKDCCILEEPIYELVFVDESHPQTFLESEKNMHMALEYLHTPDQEDMMEAIHPPAKEVHQLTAENLGDCYWSQYPGEKTNSPVLLSMETGYKLTKSVRFTLPSGEAIEFTPGAVARLAAMTFVNCDSPGHHKRDFNEKELRAEALAVELIELFGHGAYPYGG